MPCTSFITSLKAPDNSVRNPIVDNLEIIACVSSGFIRNSSGGKYLADNKHSFWEIVSMQERKIITVYGE